MGLTNIFLIATKQPVTTSAAKRVKYPGEGNSFCDWYYSRDEGLVQNLSYEMTETR